MADITPRDVVRNWLIQLGLRCAPTKAAEDVELRLLTYAPALAKDIAEQAFCDACLEEIARKFEHFPAYATLRKAIEKWLDANKPRQAALPGMDPDMPMADQAMVRIWREFRGGTRGLARGATIESWLDMARRPTPAAFKHLVANDAGAREIALRRGWIREPESAPPAEDTARVVHTVVEAQRPQVPADPPPRPTVPDPIVAFHAKHGRRPGELTPAQTAALRMATPGLREIAERQATVDAQRRLAEQAFAQAAQDRDEDDDVIVDLDKPTAWPDRPPPEPAMTAPPQRLPLPPLRWDDGC